MIIFPDKINKGSVIGVTATSSGMENATDLNKLNNAIINIEKMGFDVVETENVRKVDKLVSSSGEERAKEFLNLWNDKKVRYIIAKSGGEFLMEMLPYLHKEKIDMCEPDWVQGFSDTSLLLFYLTTNYNLATVEASNFTRYCMDKWDESIANTLHVLQNERAFTQNNFELYETHPINREEGKELEPYNLTEKIVYKNLFEERKVEITGRLIGGCIDVLRTIIGTKLDNTKNFCSQFKEGMIWHLENCELSVCDLYRSLWQMREAGWFENAKGIIIGRTIASVANGEFTYEDALKSAFTKLNIPVIYDVDFGHVMPQWTLINGTFAKFEYENGKGKITQEMK